MKEKEIQKELEKLHNKNLLWKRIYEELNKDQKILELINGTSNPKLALKALAYMTLYKRLDIATLVAMLFKPEKDKLSDIVLFVEELKDKHLINFDTDRNQFIVRFILDSDVEDQINAFQYPLPLITKPKLIKHNMSSAYYQKNKQSVLLNNKTTKSDVDLEHLNLMNQIAFSINLNVLAKAQNHWDPKKNPEMTMRNFQRFNKFCKVAQKLIIENGNKFYFSHRFDYRGRCYDEGYYIHYQGNDYCKSLLEFANKELIN